MSFLCRVLPCGTAWSFLREAAHQCFHRRCVSLSYLDAWQIKSVSARREGAVIHYRDQWQGSMKEKSRKVDNCGKVPLEAVSSVKNCSSQLSQLYAEIGELRFVNLPQKTF